MKCLRAVRAAGGVVKPCLGGFDVESIATQLREVKVGSKLGRLEVLSEVSGAAKRRWLCRCECGVEKQVSHWSLQRGATNSCGCLNRELCSKRSTTHGLSHEIAEYRIWCGIKSRCFNPNRKFYESYGGRGITVCWRFRKSFEAFLADVGKRPSQRHSIDRINNNSHYSCGKCEECLENEWTANCHWATPKEQNQNTRTNRMITFNGKAQCAAAWGDEVGIPGRYILQRIDRYGWSVERALKVPVAAELSKGERSGKAKLTEENVVLIRQLVCFISHREIGELFGIDGSTVSRIVTKQRWSHI